MNSILACAPNKKLHRLVQDIGFYTPKSGLKHGGPFADDRYSRLGAVGVLRVVAGIPFEGICYRFSLFENPAVPGM